MSRRGAQLRDTVSQGAVIIYTWLGSLSVTVFRAPLAWKCLWYMPVNVLLVDVNLDGEFVTFLVS